MVAPIVIWGLLALAGIIGIVAVIGIPKRPAVTEEEVLAVALTTEDKLINLAIRATGLPRGELTVRGLLPIDLGLTTWDYTPGAAGYNTMANTTIADNTFIAFTGVTYPEPLTTADVSAIRITAAGRLAEIWNIQHLWGAENPVFIDSTPLIVSQNRPITICVYAITGGVAETIALRGIVVEPRGVTIA